MSENPYLPPNLLVKAEGSKWLKYGTTATSFGLVGSAVAGIAYSFWRFGFDHIREYPRAVFLETISFSLAIGVVVFAVSIMCRLTDLGLLRTSALVCIAGIVAVIASSISSELLGLSPRSYDDAAGSWYRPTCTLLLFASGLIAVLGFLQRKKKREQ